MNKTLSNAILKLLRPLVRVMLSHGISYGEFIELARQSFVTTADNDYPPESRKQSISRIAMMTGINRKEVARIRDYVTGLKVSAESSTGNENKSSLSQDTYNRGVRIISGWNRDAAFCDDDGIALPLPFDGTDNSFTMLVKKYSGDIPARAALDELLRVGAIRLLGSGEVSLCNDTAYVPDKDQEAKFQILGNSTADLLTTIEHNLNAETGTTRLQLTTAYNNLPQSAVEAFRKLSREDGIKLLRKMDLWLAAHDRDANTEITESNDSRMRLGIGIYYIEEDLTRENRT